MLIGKLMVEDLDSRPHNRTIAKMVKFCQSSFSIYHLSLDWVYRKSKNIWSCIARCLKYYNYKYEIRILSLNKTLMEEHYKMVKTSSNTLILTWNLSILLSMFNDMEVVCSGFRSNSHSWEISFQKISGKKIFGHFWKKNI